MSADDELRAVVWAMLDEEFSGKSLRYPCHREGCERLATGFPVDGPDRGRTLCDEHLPVGVKIEPVDHTARLRTMWAFWRKGKP